jgi:hypothetical protein
VCISASNHHFSFFLYNADNLDLRRVRGFLCSAFLDVVFREKGGILNTIKDTPEGELRCVLLPF